MESYIQISKINDFLYSPKSLYLHSVFESFNQDLYHERPQREGRLNHRNIEEGKYSTTKRYLQGISVYSERYNIGGKIDIYDKQTLTLVERKTKVKKVYEGHRFQLYAQMICLEEIGYKVKQLKIHSLSDNRRYEVSLPNKEDLCRFGKILSDIRKYDVLQCKSGKSDYRCDMSIYRHLSY